MSMQDIRSLMVQEVVGGSLKGVITDTDAAAAGMGNSTVVWASHYDKGKRARMLASGQAQMVAARQTLLGAGQGGQVSVDEEGAARALPRRRLSV